MSYLPPVVARLSMDLGEFDAAIDRAKAKIKSLDETVRIKTDVSSNGAGSLRSQLTDLEKISREASRINNRNVMSLKLADGTRTWEQLIAIDREMARLNGKTAKVHVKVDKNSFLNDIKQMFSEIGGLGGGHSFNLPFTSMTANPIGVAGIAGGIAALLPELAGVVSGFAAAGAGAGAFYLLAHPAINNLTQDVRGLDQANYKLGIAQNAYQLDPSKKNLAALTKAQEQYNATLRQMGKDAGPAASAAMKLRSEYSKITTAFQPETFKVLGAGIKLIADMLPKAVPFASTFADSMSKWLTNLDKASKGQAFQNFLKQFHSIEGPALQSITAGIGNVAGSIGRLLTVMSGKDVAHTINIAFSAISGTISGITASVKFLMNAFDGMKLAGHNIASTFDGVRHEIAAIFSGIGHDIEAKVKGAFNGAAGWFTGLYNGAKSAAKQVVQGFAGIPAAIKGIFNGANGLLNSAGSQIIHGLVNGARSTWATVSSWFSGLGGKVKGFFGGARGWLVSAGSAIMSGLLAGITSAWGKVAGFLSGLAAKIRSLKGPLDYDRVMLYPHGQAIMQGLMHGMQSQVPALESQLKGITNTISNTAGHAAGGGGEPIHVHVHMDSREIYSAVQERAVGTQRRTGHNGMTKRTR